MLIIHLQFSFFLDRKFTTRTRFAISPVGTIAIAMFVSDHHELKHSVVAMECAVMWKCKSNIFFLSWIIQISHSTDIDVDSFFKNYSNFIEIFMACLSLSRTLVCVIKSIVCSSLEIHQMGKK